MDIKYIYRFIPFGLRKHYIHIDFAHLHLPTGDSIIETRSATYVDILDQRLFSDGFHDLLNVFDFLKCNLRVVRIYEVLLL
jgi:hypothetical protein